MNKLQDQFVIEAGSADPLPPLQWDMESLKALTAQYERDSASYGSWKGMMGARGKVDEKIRHIAAAAAWGLFPEWDATYLNYVYLNMRIRKLPDDKGGIEATRKLQEAATIEAKSAVPYVTPDIVVDQKTMEKIRQALIADVQAGKLPDTSNAQGSLFQTNPQDHLYATAYGWGGLSVEHAAYLPIINPTEVKDAKCAPSSLTFTPPEIDYDRGGFWSITTYDSEGWLARDKAAISNSEAVANPDGSYTIRFNSLGSPNNIETPSPFTVLLRIYVPMSKDGVTQYLQKASKELMVK